MPDDIETLRVFIDRCSWSREYRDKALATLERVKEELNDYVDAARSEADRVNELTKERNALRAKLEKAREALEECVAEFAYIDEGKTVSVRARTVLAELSADAPAQTPQISDEDDDNLKPCPFCGGEAEEIYIEEEGPNFGGSCICCKTCGASSAVHFDRKENLASSWNARRNPRSS